MNVERVRASCYCTFPEVDLQIPAGCSALAGPNGAGKSSLVEAIPLSLFGPPAGTRTLAPYSTRGSTDATVTVEATVSHRGERFRVRRGYSVRGRGKPLLDFEVERVAGWEPLTLESAAATQTMIEQRLGLTRRTYCLSGYVGQRQGGAWTAAEPAQRKSMFFDVLGLGRWQRRLDLVRADVRAAEQRAAVVDDTLRRDSETLARLPEQRQQLAGLAAREAKAASDLAAAERDLDTRTTEAQEAQQRAAERRAAQAEADQAAEALRRLADRDQAAQAAQESIDVAKAELAGLASPDDVAAAEERYSEARAAYDAAMLERATLTAKLADAEQRWRDLTAEQQHVAVKVGQTDARAKRLQAALDNPSGEVCALCQRPHTGESVHREIEACWADLTSLDQRSRELLTAAREWETRTVALRDELATAGTVAAPSDHEVRRAREQLDRRARLEERVKSWQQTTAEAAAPEHMDAKADALYQAETARQRLAALPPLDTAQLDRVKAAEVNARGLVNLTRQQLSDVREQKARLEADVDRLAILERKHGDDQAEATTLRGMLNELRPLERAFGQNGIPIFIVEEIAIPAIEPLADALLSDFGGIVTRVELRTQEMQKTTDKLSETLNLACLTDDGESPYERLSGGEKTRVDLALRLAVAQYLGIENVVLDEPTDLDAEGTDRLVAALRGLTDRGVFAWALVISHVAELRDSFDNVISVVREGGRSRVAESAATGYAPEPVAA